MGKGVCQTGRWQTTEKIEQDIFSPKVFFFVFFLFSFFVPRISSYSFLSVVKTWAAGSRIELSWRERAVKG